MATFWCGYVRHMDVVIFCKKFIVFIYVCNCFLGRPDGEKKAYVRLMPDYDALDVANKVSFTLWLSAYLWCALW